jgi:hypothetical protein
MLLAGISKDQLAAKGHAFISEINSLLVAEGVSSGVETYQRPMKDRWTSRDVHGFITLASDPSKVLHIQIYPSMSSEAGVCLVGRVMDKDTMLRLRKTESIGNEHDAVIDRPRALAQKSWPDWDAKLVTQTISEALNAISRK